MVEIGNFSLTVAFVVAIYAAVAPIYGVKKSRPEFVKSSEYAVLAVSLLTSLSTAALIYAFVTRDFSIKYVADYSSKNLSMVYTVSAFYAGQAGSLLFWGWFLSAFCASVILQNRDRNRELMPYVVSILMGVAIFFLLVMVFLASPFEKLPYKPADGRGLNPLLQNPGMFFHPPTLYIGYIGFTIPFAFAMAALITGKLGDEWIRTTRRWTIFAWYFLMLGNIFGSWWAYVELGWGGFWMWDPVENASFMPWLTGTAFLHSVMIQEKKNMLKVWNMVLIIVTFTLTLFGTFLTRSGILSSVHTFSQSSLGPFFLSFIAIVLFLSLSLLFSRLRSLKSENELDSVLSRESAFLFNNLFLVGAAFAIFWGTVFPLISEAVRGVKITVGPPFYNQVMVPIFLMLLLLTGICPLIAWRKASASNLRKNFLHPLSASLIGGSILFLLGANKPYALISFSLVIFVFWTISLEFWRGARARMAMAQESFARATFNLVWRNKRRYGGYVVHLGVIMMFVGATGSAFTAESQANLKKGESMEIKDYKLVLNDLYTRSAPSYRAVGAQLAVYRNGEQIGILKPEKNFHQGHEEQPTTEVDVRSTLKEDLFLILAGYEGDSATIKAIINPLINWLWYGAFVLTAGTMIALLPERRKTLRPYATDIPGRKAKVGVSV